MLARIKKTSKNVHLLNDSGYTLLEMLIAMMILLVIASILPIGLRIIQNEGVFVSGIQRMEWEVFSSQVKKEIRAADEMTVRTDRILLRKNGKVILYEKYGTNMRRRVDYQGHEILIQNLSSFQFEKIPMGVQIIATDLNGELFSARAHNFIQIGEVTP